MRDLPGLERADGTRPLKILHVGNVAQNAYINASVLRARGHDCDMVAPDLYHVGSSPEWYELAFADIDVAALGGDAFFPDFYALGRDMPALGDWVAQGPSLMALRYLLFRRRRDPRAHAALATLLYQRFKATIDKTTSPNLEPWTEAVFEEHLGRYDLRPAFCRRLRLGREAARWFDWIRNRVALQAGPDFVRAWGQAIARGTLDQFSKRDPVLMGAMGSLRARGLAEAYGIEYVGPQQDFDHVEAYGFTTSDVAPYGVFGLVLRELASLYDVCLFYGDSCKYAFVAGVPVYWALEHGTIRSIPFQPTVDGRIVAASYLRASRVFLTNTDYASAKQRLEFDPTRRVYFPHPFDEKPAFAFSKGYRGRSTEGPVIFFCPARQDWKEHGLASGMSKGNDLYFLAAKMLVERGRTDFVLHCIDWGVDRLATRALITELGLDDHVLWLPLMSKRKLWAAKLDAHAVLDQFIISALGGVSFETLALGRRLISRDDGVNNAVFFEEPPPILAAATVDEIAVRMEEVLSDPGDVAGIGQRGVEWISRFHSAERLVALQQQAFA